MKNKHSRPPKLGQSFEKSRLITWPMVAIGWAMAGYAVLSTLTRTGLQ